MQKFLEDNPAINKSNVSLYGDFLMYAMGSESQYLSKKYEQVYKKSLSEAEAFSATHAADLNVKKYPEEN